MLNSQILDATSRRLHEHLMEQALVWIAVHFPDCQPDEVPIYQEVYVNRILIAVSDQL